MIPQAAKKASRKRALHNPCPPPPPTKQAKPSENGGLQTHGKGATIWSVPTLRQLAVNSLTHLMEAGQHRLPVDDEARGILRQWVQGKPATNEPPHAESIAAAAPAPPPVAEDAQAHPESPRSVEDKLAYLRERAQNWKPARALGSLRDTMVFATGDPHARLMLVGEAPGCDEERLREPFVGRAGQKLNQILTAMGLSREGVYISNVCKFRPSMGENQGTANRPPNEAEIAACLPLILAEIRAIHPACIVCLGGSAAKGLLGDARSVSALRGQWLACQGIPVRVTYHPSYLLRNESLSARRAVWEDMLAAMEQLGLPISDKQRRYFL